MGLKPLEFSDCLLDSPYFRENIHEHERELEKTNDAIKLLIKECKTLVKAMGDLSRAQRSFCHVLKEFQLNYIGEIDTQDEIEIAEAFSDFADLIDKVEEQREHMLESANVQLIKPLENFRKDQILDAKEEKSKFDKETQKFCGQLDKHLQISPKKKEGALQDADANIELDRRNFYQISMDYVAKLQEVNEKKKFELVEIMLSFLYGQSTFFHHGYEVFKDYQRYLTDLQYKLQSTRERFNYAQERVEELKRKKQEEAQSGELQKGAHGHQGYLFVQDKKRGAFGTTWSKHYCNYKKENRILTMLPYVQTTGKPNASTDTMVVAQCVRRATEQSERRFCFDVTGMDRPQPIVVQAISEEDRRLWLESMDGKEPIYMDSTEIAALNDASEINDTGIEFVTKCISGIEKRGITDQGLYRVAGVASKYNNLLALGLDKRQLEKLDLESESSEYEVKTITSALKQYFRNLSEPILTYALHEQFLAAIKLNTPVKKVLALRDVVKELPEVNRSVLQMLLEHLQRVASHSDKNLMQHSNLGVVLGPTLMRPREETMAAIMNIKYQSVVVEMLIKEYDAIFAENFSPAALEDETSEQDKTVKRGTASEVSNGPTKVTAPAKVTSPAGAALYAKPFSFNKYPAPPPPPTQKPKPKTGKAQSADSDEDSPASCLTTESSSTGSAGSAGQSSPSFFTKETRSSSNTSISNSEVFSPPWKRENPLPPSPSQRRAGSTSSRCEPIQKRIVESVTPFTGASKAQAPLAERDESFSERESTTDSDSRRLGQGGGVRRPGSQRSPIPPARPLHSSDNQELPKKERHPSHPDYPPPPVPKRNNWKVKALYDCVGSNESELSFSIGEIIFNVRNSAEDGWLLGTLNGRTGLIPENYVETVERQ